MTKVSELGLNDIGKIVRVKSEKISGQEFSYGVDALVMGTLESVTTYPDGEALVKISGQTVYVKAAIEIETKESEFLENVKNEASRATERAGQWLSRSNIHPPKS